MQKSSFATMFIESPEQSPLVTEDGPRRRGRARSRHAITPRERRWMFAALVACCGWSGALSGCGDDAPPVCPDADGDGQGAVPCGEDCDDTNPAIFAGNPEVCDGYDNNCDLVIDDGDFVDVDATLLSNVPADAALTWSEQGNASYSTAAATFVFQLGADGFLSPSREVQVVTGGQYTVLVDESLAGTGGCVMRRAQWLASTECATDTECPRPACAGAALTDGGFWSVGTCATVDGGFATLCRRDDDCAWPCASERCVPPSREDVQLSECRLKELATSSVSADGAFAVGVETAGCAAGRLRAGWLTSTDAQLLTFGPEARSNVWLGVDVGAFTPPGTAFSMACSGAGRASGTPGAARPAVAALSATGATEALTVYLGDTQDRQRCGDAVDIPVEGLGLFLESGRGAFRAWVTGTGDGHPETFGDTNGGGPPAVVALDGHGWIVAYPKATPTGGTPVALHFVGELTPPATFSLFGPDGGTRPAHVPRETAALAPGAPFLEIPATGRADYVKLAVGRSGATGYDVGVTWMEDCATSGAETVWFSLVHVDTSSPSAATATAPVQLSTGTARGGFPAIVYAGADVAFLRAGASGLDAGVPVGPTARSGFIVAWAGVGRTGPESAVYAVRVSEADGLPIDARPIPMHATAGTTNAASVTLYATPPASSGTVSFAYWNNDTDLMGGRLICPAR
jgi:hypothetical protein